jgi:hypothetical protein
MSIKSIRTGWTGISALAGNPVLGDFESIETASGTGSSGVVTFNNIPSTFQHLQIRWISKSTNTGSYNWLNFNGDTTALYANHYVYGDGASTFAGVDANAARINLYGSSVTSSQTNTFASHTIDILDYRNTDKFKTVRAFGGQDSNGSGVIFLSSGLWRSTTAISSITITANSDNFNSNSRFALYGIR